MSAARNFALGQVESEWLYPLDADDLLVGEGLLKALREFRDEEKLGFIVGGRTYFGDSELDDFRSAGYFDVGELSNRGSSPAPLPPNNSILRTEAALRAGGWAGLRLGEDGEILRAVGFDWAGRVVPWVFSRYRKWTGQTTGDAYYIERGLGRAFAFKVAQAKARARNVELCVGKDASDWPNREIDTGVEGLVELLENREDSSSQLGRSRVGKREVFKRVCERYGVTPVRTLEGGFSAWSVEGFRGEE